MLAIVRVARQFPGGLVILLGEDFALPHEDPVEPEDQTQDEATDS